MLVTFDITTRFNPKCTDYNGKNGDKIEQQGLPEWIYGLEEVESYVYYACDGREDLDVYRPVQPEMW